MNPEFENGKKLSLHSAFALFVIMMGFLFLIDANTGMQNVASLSLLLLGLIWYGVHEGYVWWRHHHPRHWHIKH